MNVQEAKEALESALDAHRKAMAHVDRLVDEQGKLRDKLNRAEGRTRLGTDRVWVERARGLRTECEAKDCEVLAAREALRPLALDVQAALDALLPKLAENERWAVLHRCRRALVGGG